MNIEWTKTGRNFIRGEFKDLYDNECSVQQSSLATEHAIWLGCNSAKFDCNNIPYGTRMHLTKEMARDLATILLKFATTGELK